MALPRYQNFVNGMYTANQTGEFFDVINPATAQVIYQVEIADESIKSAAIDSAKKGFAIWSAMTAIERTRVLNRAAALLRERNDELAHIEVLDTGKPWQEAECVDVVSGADAIEYYAGLAPAVVGQQQSVGADFYYTRKEPLGLSLIHI